MVHAIFEKHMVCNSPGDTITNGNGLALVKSLTVSESLPEGFVDEDRCGGLPVIPQFSEQHIRDQQLADPRLREGIAQRETGEKLPPDSPERAP